jgi:hypothetical protein
MRHANQYLFILMQRYEHFCYYIKCAGRKRRVTTILSCYYVRYYHVVVHYDITNLF